VGGVVVRVVKAKKFRRQLRREVKRLMHSDLALVYKLPWRERMKLAWHMMIGRSPKEEINVK